MTVMERPTEIDPTARTAATPAAGVLAVVVGVTLNVVAARAHHHYDPKDSDGWSDVPVYAVAGLVGYAVAFWLAPWRLRRQQDASAVPRTALTLAVVSVVLLPLAYWTALPFVVGTGAVLLAGDAARHRRASAMTTVSTVIGSLPALLGVGIVVYRIVEAFTH